MMWRFAVPLVITTLIGWILVYGTPPKWRGKVWVSIKTWLLVLSIVVIGLFVITAVYSIYQGGFT